MKNNRSYSCRLCSKSSLAVLFSGILFFLLSCDSSRENQSGKTNAAERKEILIYCGITMAQPVMELAAIIEKENNCTIKISYGESEWLKNTALTTRIGDIFFPGAPSYLDSMLQDGTVTDTVVVGENRIALMVQKDNPKHVSPDLKELLRKDLQIVLGAPDAGSVGKETRHNLEKVGIYEQALEKALYLTADSKGLSQALRSKDADVVVNWRAAVTFKDNAQYIDVIPLPEEQTEGRILTMGLLSFSNHPDLAKYYLEQTVSDRGRAIFSRYGF